jgi:PAS domain S-box-containing protein
VAYMSVTTTHGSKDVIESESLNGWGPGGLRLAPRLAAVEDSRLLRAEDRWDLLAQAAEQGLWDWVPGTDEMDWSPQLTRMLGYADSEITPGVASFNELIHPEDHAQAWRAFDEHAQGKTEVCRTEFRLRAKDGSFRWIESRAKARFDASGNVARMVGLHTDISARKGPGAGPAAQGAGRTSSVDLPLSSARCRGCHSDLLVRSRRRVWEWPLALLMLRPIRCRTCGNRALKPFWAA